jgi:hypothetical protein
MACQDCGLKERKVAIEPNEEQEVRLKSLFDTLKKHDSQALAMELAGIMVGWGIGDVVIDRVLESVKKNSGIARRNKVMTTRNKKRARLFELSEKKKLTRAEEAEAMKLMKELKA